MASDESSNSTSASQMSPAELSALAARLRARAESVLLQHQPEQHRDLHTAATFIEGIASSNLITIDMKGGTVAAISGLPPGASYMIRYLDAIAGGC